MIERKKQMNTDKKTSEQRLTTYAQSVFISGHSAEPKRVPSRNVTEIFKVPTVDYSGLAYMNVYTQGEDQRPEGVRRVMVGSLVTPEDVSRHPELHPTDKKLTLEEFTAVAKKPETYVTGHMCDIPGMGPTAIRHSDLVVNEEGHQLWPKTDRPTPAVAAPAP
jgi:hypothetical protein